MLEVDNRAPEFAPMHEPVRGVKHKKGLFGTAAPFIAAAVAGVYFFSSTLAPASRQPSAPPKDPPVIVETMNTLDPTSTLTPVMTFTPTPTATFTPTPTATFEIGRAHV